MSTIDDKSHLNQNQNAFSTNFIPNEQQQQQNETKKFLKDIGVIRLHASLDCIFLDAI